MQLLRPLFLLSAMPKGVRGKKGGPPSTSGVRHSTRRGRMPARLVDGPVVSTATIDVAELQAENELLRQQLAQTQAAAARFANRVTCLEGTVGTSCRINLYYSYRPIVYYPYRLISSHPICSAGAATDVVCSTACSCCHPSICPGLAGKCTRADGGEASGGQCSATHHTGIAHAGSAGRCEAADDFGPGSIWRVSNI